ncbi:MULTISPECIES: hypothetical protein [Paenibacillus]|uniref:Uncharacterized protein n=1 Tax=Paenibacillus borealis TaxID=160799 RepID=A0ABX3HDA5_PAEBO|nr:hypothetical protein [Paenibacillus borealis]OMD47101.1 hypothetical protein BSK56_14885 [Paenibacillus borealis]
MDDSTKELAADVQNCFRQRLLQGVQVMQGFIFKKDYRENEVLRKSLSGLAASSFGISFEQWYQEDSARFLSEVWLYPGTGAALLYRLYFRQHQLRGDPEIRRDSTG